MRALRRRAPRLALDGGVKVALGGIHCRLCNDLLAEKVSFTVIGLLRERSLCGGTLACCGRLIQRGLQLRHILLRGKPGMLAIG